MSELALVADDTVVSASVLAEGAHVPPHYVSKIMRKLAAAKLVTATKGPGGGFRLARRKKSIRFLDIMAAVGEEPKPDHCVFGWGRCNAAVPCSMHASFSKINDQLWRWATETTLADISSPAPRPKS